jgi:hypothetical protein
MMRGDGQMVTRKRRRRLEFSKLILIFETVLVGYVSYRVLGFVETAIATGFDGSLPYLTTFISAVWAAYGASVSFYQNKSGKENVKKIEASAVNMDRDA